jgi:hypothetical protein
LAPLAGAVVDNLLRPALSSCNDHHGGTEGPADAAAAVILEETHADGAIEADLSVSARADDHPVRGFHAHGAAGAAGSIIFVDADGNMVGRCHSLRLCHFFY